MKTNDEHTMMYSIVEIKRKVPDGDVCTVHKRMSNEISTWRTVSARTLPIRFEHKKAKKLSRYQNTERRIFWKKQMKKMLWIFFVE